VIILFRFLIFSIILILFFFLKQIILILNRKGILGTQNFQPNSMLFFSQKHVWVPRWVKFVFIRSHSTRVGYPITISVNLEVNQGKFTQTGQTQRPSVQRTILQIMAGNCRPFFKRQKPKNGVLPAAMYIAHFLTIR
jgi:hypothetical protein